MCIPARHVGLLAQVAIGGRHGPHAGGKPCHDVALVVADMPFGSYQCGEDRAMRNAVRFLTKGMADVVKLVQYFRDLRHYPAYNRVRGLFFPQPVVSTVVEVSRMLPVDGVLVEVEATFHIPSQTAADR